MNRTQTNASNRNANTNANTNDNTNNNNIPSGTLRLVMSCDVFWKYEMDIVVDRQQFDPKLTNRNQEESEAFDILSRHLCAEMKKHIHTDLTLNAAHGLIRKLEEIYPKFHIHGLNTHEILYPFDPCNSAHSRGDGKVFICTHC
jgi:hypothetical protein